MSAPRTRRLLLSVLVAGAGLLLTWRRQRPAPPLTTSPPRVRAELLADEPTTG